MKKTPQGSGVEWVRSKDSRKFNTRFSPPLQARRILKAPPPFKSVGEVVARVVLRISPNRRA